MYVLLLIVFILLAVGYYFMNRQKFSSKVIEYRDFSCAGMSGFTFKYPVFKKWEIKGIKNTAQNECAIFLSDEVLKKNNINTEIVPQITVALTYYADKQNSSAPSYLKDTNPNGVRYGKSGIGYDFWVGDSSVVVKVGLVGVPTGQNFSKGQFFKKVIETFKLIK